VFPPNVRPDWKVIASYKHSSLLREFVNYGQKKFSKRRHLFREGARLLRGDRAQVTQVGLVADEHDDDVGVGVVAKLSKPAFDVLVGQVLRDVVHLVSML